MTQGPKSRFVFFWLVICAFVAFFGSEYIAQQMGLILIYGLLALSFTYVWGIGGVFSLCQAALFGIGAYAYGTVSINLAEIPAAGFIGLVVAILVPVLAAAVFGWFIFFGRLSGMYVAVATLALDLALLTFMDGTASPSYAIGDAALGGQNGMVGIMPLSFGPPDSDEGFDNHDFLVFVAILNLLITLGVWASLKSRWFTVILAIRDNELRARTLGFDSRYYRLGLFMAGAAIAGMAGGEYASQQLFVSTNVFTLSMAAMVIIWVLLGGKRSIPGAYVGAGLLQLLVLALAGSGSDIEVFASGFIMILTVTLLPDGLTSLVSRLGRWRSAASTTGGSGSFSTSPAVPPAEKVEHRAEGLEMLFAATSRPIRHAGLDTQNLGKSFGGVAVLDGLSLEFVPRSITCIVGPNGAGKSTFFNLICGRHTADQGRILVAGTDIVRMRMEDRIGLGISVKYQAPELFSEVTVREHLKLSICAAHDRIGWHQADEYALAWERFFSLELRSKDAAKDLSHGDAQRLDIAMAISCQPDLLLLDEPTAGLNPTEIRYLEQMIRILQKYMTVLVITHDFSFVSRLASRILVMSEGRLFRSGSVEELKEDAEFIKLYLGKRGSFSAH